MAACGSSRRSIPQARARGGRLPVSLRWLGQRFSSESSWGSPGHAGDSPASTLPAAIWLLLGSVVWLCCATVRAAASRPCSDGGSSAAKPTSRKSSRSRVQAGHPAVLAPSAALVAKSCLRSCCRLALQARARRPIWSGQRCSIVPRSTVARHWRQHRATRRPRIQAVTWPSSEVTTFYTYPEQTRDTVGPGPVPTVALAYGPVTSSV